MSFNLVIVGRVMSGIACLGAAAYLATTGSEGWGWFLFAGVLLAGVGIESKKEGKV